jgi:predicted nucleic acid-binding Zn ribbon protein
MSGGDGMPEHQVDCPHCGHELRIVCDINDHELAERLRRIVRVQAVAPTQAAG